MRVRRTWPGAGYFTFYAPLSVCTPAQPTDWKVETETQAEAHEAKAPAPSQCHLFLNPEPEAPRTKLPKSLGHCSPYGATKEEAGVEES